MPAPAHADCSDRQTANADRGRLQVSLTAIEDDLTQQATSVLAETSVAIDRAYADVVAAMRSAHQRLTGLRDAHASRVRALTGELNTVKQELHADKIDAEAVLRCTRELDALRIEHDALVQKKTRVTSRPSWSGLRRRLRSVSACARRPGSRAVRRRARPRRTRRRTKPCPH